MTESADVFIKVRVKPGQPNTGIIREEDGILHISLHARAQEGKANIELVKFLSRHFKKKAEIVSGKSSRKKLVKLT
jgi:uncharacterized protein (TIGR00251 family)